MVTTRRGNDTNSPQVTGSVTRSGLKRVLDDSVATPTRTTKKRRSVEKVEKPQFESTESDVSEDKQANGQSEGDKTYAGAEEKNDASHELETPVPKKGRGRPAKKRESSTAVVIETSATKEKDEQAPAEADASEAESVYDTPASQGSDSVYATPATTLRAGTRGSAAKATPQSATAAKSTGKPSKSTPSKLASQETNNEEDEEPTPKAATSKNTHIRFGSEDPPAVPESAPLADEIPSSTFEPEQQEVEDDESDDDAPEAVSANTARQQAEAAEAEAAIAKEKEQAALKRKRQERDARLRDQAEASKRRKQQQPKETPSTTTTTTKPQPTSTKPSYDLSTIPDLLPLELLESAPSVRPPTPPTTTTTTTSTQPQSQKKNKHLKFLDNDKPAKDVKRGPVTVRVLQQQNRLLPPKVSRGSRDLREAWLKGERGGKGKGKGRMEGVGGLQRRKAGGGFLRR